MSVWEQYGIQDKVLQILADVPDKLDGHHLGWPFLSAYQIAIEFAKRHPADFKAIGKPLGGAGTGQHDSLSQYLGQQLSIRIRDGRIPVEGVLISNQHLHDIAFKHQGQVIHSSLTGSEFTLSMFRLSDRKGR